MRPRSRTDGAAPGTGADDTPGAARGADPGAGRPDHPLLQLQRDTLRRLREADAARHRAEEAALAGVAAMREKAAADVRTVESGVAKAVKDAESALPAAREALERVKMAQTPEPARFERTSGDPGTELPVAVSEVEEAARRVTARVRAYEEWVATRRTLRRVGIAAAGATLVVALIRFTGGDPEPADGSLLQREFQNTSAPLYGTAEPVVLPVETTAPSGGAGEEPDVGAVRRTEEAPAGPRPPAPPARDPDEPDRALYSFAVRDLEGARAALDRGDYAQVRRTLAGTTERLEGVASRFPRSSAVRELRGDAVYLMERAATACQAERLADEQRGEAPRDCN